MLLIGMKLKDVTQKLNSLYHINTKKANSFGFAFFMLKK